MLAGHTKSLGRSLPTLACSNVKMKSDVEKNKSASEETLSSMNELPAGRLPTKRQVILRILHEDSYLQKTASNAVAKDLVDRWIWSMYIVFML